MKSTFKIYTSNGAEVEPDFTFYPGGEIGVKLNDIPLMNRATVTVVASIRDSDGVMALALIKEVLDTLHIDRILLEFEYCPYQRQDRRTEDGEAFSLKVFANMVNAMNFFSVELADPHSNVSTALFDRCHVLDTTLTMVHFVQSFGSDIVLVAPDIGASKRVAKIAQNTGLPFIIATKTRDEDTGKLSAPAIHDDVKDMKLLIIDDICDGGYTFIQLAKLLKDRGAASVELFVTHGIFSKGLPLANVDHVYSMFPWIPSNEHMTEVDL